MYKPLSNLECSVVIRGLLGQLIVRTGTMKTFDNSAAFFVLGVRVYCLRQCGRMPACVRRSWRHLTLELSLADNDFRTAIERNSPAGGRNQPAKTAAETRHQPLPTAISAQGIHKP